MKENRCTKSGGWRSNWLTFQFDDDLDANQHKVTVNNDLYQKTIAFNGRNLPKSTQYSKGTDTVLGYSYTYDDNSQLIQEVLPDGSINKYEYDDVGNRRKGIRGNQTDM